jgi:hypothetical protein
MPPTTPGPKSPKRDESFENLQTAAETIGGLPSLNLKDHVFQAIVIVVCVGIGLPIGWYIATNNGGEGSTGLLLGAIGGLIIGTLISGGILMVLGWVRAAKRLGNKK